MRRRQRGRGGQEIDLGRDAAELPDLRVGHPDRRRKPPVAGLDGQGAPHRAVERVGPGQQRTGRRDAIRCLRR